MSLASKQKRRAAQLLPVLVKNAFEETPANTRYVGEKI